MKKCIKCNMEFQDDAGFCTKCGGTLTVEQSKKPKSNKNRFWIIVGLVLLGAIAYKVTHLCTYMIIKPEGVYIPVKGGTYYVNLEYDGVFYRVDGATEWLSLDKSSDRVRLDADINNTGVERWAFLGFKSGDCYKVVPVMQNANPTFFNVSPESVIFDRNEDYQTIRVEHDGLDYEILSYPSSWMHIVKKDNSFTIKVNDNVSSKNHSGYIELKCGNLIKKLPVRQGGGATQIRLEPSSLRLPKGSATHNLVWNVGVDYDGYDFEITYYSDWLYPDKEDDILVVRASDNETGSNRYGSVTIRSGDISKTLEVTQFGAASNVQLDNKSIKDDKYGGMSYTVNVKTDGTNYNINYPNFLELKECELDHFTVKFKQNDEYYRTGTIRVTSDNKVATVNVVQGGKCNVCKGSGTIPCYNCRAQGGWWGFNNQWSECFVCKGDGSLKCSTCGGDKYREAK